MLETSSRMDPGNLWTHYYLGYAYRDVGRLPEAVAAFQRVLDRVPAHADARRQISDLRTRIPTMSAPPPVPSDGDERPPTSRRSSIRIR
jgi:ferric-dicitrate binding protein FerR (iron transport regulator)